MAVNDSSDPGLLAATRLFEKIRSFVANELDETEAELFATLLAPAMAEATAEDADVTGFGSVGEWRPGALPKPLVETVRGRATGSQPEGGASAQVGDAGASGDEN